MISRPFGRLGTPSPRWGLVGPGGLEPPTSRLSGVCSNQLSYRPELQAEGRSRSHSDQNKIERATRAQPSWLE